MSDKRHIAILGSTGSIGTQALEVVREHSDYFQVEVLVANRNSKLLIQQALEFTPNAVVIADEKKYNEVVDALVSHDIKVYAGEDAVCQIVELDTIDIVLAAIVGYAGLRSTLSAIEAGKQIALANKETLVVAGEMITNKAREKGVNIFPVDSEHSAIFQCLSGEFDNPIEKIILTASGGPFRGKKVDFLADVTPEQALKHPNWEMGDKITIDSASLMNKGLEVIEAYWLFHVRPEQIEVVVHPQSIVHSMVQFEDGSMKAQLGLPDMKLPIQYALGYPKRLASNYKRFNFMDYPSLSFEAPNTKIFRNLAMAYEALRRGGNVPCMLNASNEIVVEAFLNKQIGFLQMSDIIEEAIEEIKYIPKPSYEDCVETDLETRRFSQRVIDNLG